MLSSKWLLVFESLLIGIALSSCFFVADERATTRLPFRAARLEDAVILAQACDAGATPTKFQIQKVHQWHQGANVIFEVTCPPDPGRPRPVPLLGYSYVEQQGNFWASGPSNAFGSLDDPDPEQFVQISSNSGQGRNQRDVFTIVYGRTLVVDITKVEVTFADQVVRQDQVENGIFAVIVDGDVKGCEFRAFGIERQRIHQRNLQPRTQLCQP